MQVSQIQRALAQKSQMSSNAQEAPFPDGEAISEPTFPFSWPRLLPNLYRAATNLPQRLAHRLELSCRCCTHRSVACLADSMGSIQEAATCHELQLLK